MRNDTLSRLDSGGTLTVLALLMDGPQEGMPFEKDETEGAVRILEEMGLIRVTGNDGCGRMLYGLTDKGRAVGLKVLEIECTLGDGRGQIPELCMPQGCMNTIPRTRRSGECARERDPSPGRDKGTSRPAFRMYTGEAVTYHPCPQCLRGAPRPLSARKGGWVPETPRFRDPIPGDKAERRRSKGIKVHPSVISNGWTKGRGLS